MFSCCSFPLQDVAKDAAPYMRKAKKFYDGIATELVAHGHAFDLFACSLDQVCFAYGSLVINKVNIVMTVIGYLPQSSVGINAYMQHPYHAEVLMLACAAVAARSEKTNCSCTARFLLPAVMETKTHMCLCHVWLGFCTQYARSCLLL